MYSTTARLKAMSGSIEEGGLSSPRKSHEGTDYRIFRSTGGESKV